MFDLVLETFLIGTVGSAQVVLAFLEVRDDFFLFVVFFLADETLYLVILALLFLKQNGVVCFSENKVKLKLDTSTSYKQAGERTLL